MNLWRSTFPSIIFEFHPVGGTDQLAGILDLDTADFAVRIVELLGEMDVFCLPGTVCEIPGYFRISLTANDDMIERAIPRFAQAMERARESSPTS